MSQKHIRSASSIHYRSMRKLPCTAVLLTGERSGHHCQVMPTGNQDSTSTTITAPLLNLPAEQQTARHVTTLGARQSCLSVAVWQQLSSRSPARHVDGLHGSQQHRLTAPYLRHQTNGAADATTADGTTIITGKIESPNRNPVRHR